MQVPYFPNSSSKLLPFFFKVARSPFSSVTQTRLPAFFLQVDLPLSLFRYSNSFHFFHLRLFHCFNFIHVYSCIESWWAAYTSSSSNKWCWLEIGGCVVGVREVVLAFVLYCMQLPSKLVCRRNPLWLRGKSIERWQSSDLLSGWFWMTWLASAGEQFCDFTPKGKTWSLPTRHAPDPDGSRRRLPSSSDPSRILTWLPAKQGRSRDSSGWESTPRVSEATLRSTTESNMLQSLCLSSWESDSHKLSGARSVTGTESVLLRSSSMFSSWSAWRGKAFK